MITSSNFRGKKRKNYFFNSYFQLNSQIFYSNFESEYLLDAKFNYSSKEYQCFILSMELATQKMRNIWKNVISITFSHVFLIFCVARSIKSMQHHFFSCISHFSCRRVHQKYETWLLLIWGIKFLHPMSAFTRNLSKNLGR